MRSRWEADSDDFSVRLRNILHAFPFKLLSGRDLGLGLGLGLAAQDHSGTNCSMRNSMGGIAALRLSQALTSRG